MVRLNARALAADGVWITWTAALLCILLVTSVLPSGQSPADTFEPLVYLTSPAEDQTVSGMVTITAEAFDASGVAGVTFEVDGASIGVEDTVAPWSIAWNATASGIGTHILTVIARDRAGNAARSDVVPVTVGGAPGPPFPPPTNHNPIAVADALTSVGRAAVAFTGASLLANDSDPDSHAVSITVVASSSSQGGSIANNGGDSYTYTPAGTFAGTDTFTYSIADGYGGTATTTVSVHVTAPAPAGLVLALGFDENAGPTALDASGGDHRGTIQGAERVSGKVGGALKFDGIDDRVTVPDSAALDLTAGLTVEAWVKPAVLNGWDTVVMKERGAGDFAYGLYANDGAPLAGGTAAPSGNIRANGGHRTLLGTSLATGVWTHVATTYDGATQRLFINGAEVSSRGQAGNIAVSDGVLAIGGNGSFAGEFFEGLIDEVRVYNRALNATEIAADMGVAAPPPPPPLPPPPPPGGPAGLVLSLNFDEASGDATDASGNGHVGTILGAARVAGVRGNALSFDGIDDFVTVPDANSLDLTTGLTVEAWVKAEMLHGWDTVVMKERGGGDFSYALYANDGAPLAGGTAAPSGNVRANNGHRTLLGTSALATGVWTHVATTYDGTTQRVFINGEEVSSRGQAGDIAVSGGVLRIGGNNAFSGEFYNGLIDEVRIYDRALSAAEIAADKDR